MNEEKDKAVRYGFDCIRDAMQALKIVDRLLFEMGGVIFPKFDIKESDCGDCDGVKGLSVSVELFFSPRRLHEYIVQHPYRKPPQDKGAA
jgi:hypothetical protein